MKRELKGFTLAEVLITLGIIGIVAAMTLPTLVQHHKKKVVETRMAKFYSIFNQALLQSKIDNGDFKYWDFPKATDAEIMEKWHDRYIKPYVKILKTRVADVGSTYRAVDWLLDGSLVVISTTSTWLFFPKADDYEKGFGCDLPDGSCYPDPSKGGIEWFTFQFTPYNNYGKNKGIEPYFTIECTNNISKECLTDTSLAQGCHNIGNTEHALCAKLIQINGWKIPDYYPFKF